MGLKGTSTIHVLTVSALERVLSYDGSYSTKGCTTTLLESQSCMTPPMVGAATKPGALPNLELSIGKAGPNFN